jgi:LysR family transcriptional regulator, hydrogen peroxide-inducible genes activator
MNFRDLEYLVTVAKLRHFGKAAEECHVSQSALSLQVQKLEREIGVQLLERTNRSVVVTEIGKEVVRRAQELLQGKRELVDAARLPDGKLPETVRIGAIPTIAPYLFSGLQTAFRKHYPSTTPLFDEAVTEQLIAAVINGELEAGIVATPVDDTLLDELELFEEPFRLAVPSRHPLVRKGQVAPQDLGKDQLLLLKDTHCLREQVIGFCSAHRVAGKLQSAASSIATLLALVRSQGGVTLVPEMAIESSSKLTGIRYLPVTPSPTRRIRLIFRKTSHVGRRLAEAARHCVKPPEDSTTSSMVHHWI